MALLETIRRSLPTSLKIWINRYLRFPPRYCTASGRSLPDFIIAGGQKCGTTSLYNYLRQHPAVKPALGQEVHYFDRHSEQSLDWYRAHFPIASKHSSMITGESTPDYLYTPGAPEKLHELLSDIKLIFLLRDPVDRALSHYHHESRKNREKRSFDEAIETELSALRDLDPDPGHKRNDSSEELFTGYVGRGLYRRHLDPWIELFDEQQWFIMDSESFFSRPREQMNRVYEFLEIPRDSEITFRQYNTGGYQTSSQSEIKRRLVTFYEPYNKALFEWLGTSYDWSEESSN